MTTAVALSTGASVKRNEKLDLLPVPPEEDTVTPLVEVTDGSPAALPELESVPQATSKLLSNIIAIACITLSI